MTQLQLNYDTARGKETITQTIYTSSKSPQGELEYTTLIKPGEQPSTFEWVEPIRFSHRDRLCQQRFLAQFAVVVMAAILLVAAGMAVVLLTDTTSIYPEAYNLLVELVNHLGYMTLWMLLYLVVRSGVYLADTRQQDKLLSISKATLIAQPLTKEKQSEYGALAATMPTVTYTAQNHRPLQRLEEAYRRTVTEAGYTDRPADLWLSLVNNPVSMEVVADFCRTWRGFAGPLNITLDDSCSETVGRIITTQTSSLCIGEPPLWDTPEH